MTMHGAKLILRLRFFKDLDILRLDLDGMGLLDFFKKRKRDDFMEPKNEHVDEVPAVQSPKHVDDNLEPAVENKFKTPPSDSLASVGEGAVDVPSEAHGNDALIDEVVTEVVDSAAQSQYSATDDLAQDRLADERAHAHVPEPDNEDGAAPSAATPSLTDDSSNNGAYLGNLEHTAIIDQLLRVPQEQRDDDWIGNFLTHVATASFVCGDPQVIQGLDNFPYFQIFIPEANKPFQCYVLEHMLDDFLLDNGLGVALEPREGAVEWVLSYGDLLHYSVHRTFAIPNDHLFGRVGEGDEVITSDEQVLVGAPAEHILPQKARGVIREFLRAQGVQEPKVCLMDRSAYGKGQDLMFNITPSQFESDAHYRAVMQALGWFLPRYYSYTGAEERVFPDQFLPL